LILGLLLLAGASITSEPVALVVQGQGPHSLQMANIIQQGQQFRVFQTNYSEAQDLFRNMQVAGIITIPQSFDSNITHHRQADVTFVVNNVDADSTNDLRRGIAIDITTFDSEQNLSSASSSSYANLNFETSLLKPTDVSILQFQSVGVVALLLLTTGLTGGALSATREWDNKTIRELLLAPTNRSAMTLAKIVSYTLTSLVTTSIILAVLLVVGLLAPASAVEWGAFVAIIVLTALFSASIGVLIANLVKRGAVIIGLSINLSFLLFFLSGGLVAVPYLPSWAQRVSEFIPLTYSISALDQVALYSSTGTVFADLIVLIFAAGIAVMASLYVSATVGSRG
jgi:ABC-2 type transport system permease protein